jgi:glycosyltransferase involved in cell wall biosynthesis
MCRVSSVGGTKVLVWQWGRRGAGPRFAASLAEGLRLIPDIEVQLSLSTDAEILRGREPPPCALPFATYGGPTGLAWRMVQGPLIIRDLIRRLAVLRPDVAICAMPGPLDLLLMQALRHSNVPVIVVVHDADPHSGDEVPLLMVLQRQLTRRADAVVALSRHVAARLGEQHVVRADRLFVVPHPPFTFGPMPSQPFSHGGTARLLCFGRLLEYKGLDLLASAMRQVGSQIAWELRVVGRGPECPALEALRALPGVTVENRWVPEDEVGTLIGWADVVVLPYKEASQSGVAPAAIAAGRLVVSTRVGGLIEQLENEDLAMLCEPDAASVAAALRDLLGTRPTMRPAMLSVDPRLAWRDAAQRLLNRFAASALPGFAH